MMRGKKNVAKTLHTHSPWKSYCYGPWNSYGHGTIEENLKCQKYFQVRTIFLKLSEKLEDDARIFKFGNQKVRQYKYHPPPPKSE